MGDLAARRAGGADHLAGGVVEPVEADEEHVGEVGRHPAAGPGGGAGRAPRRRTRCPRRGRRCRRAPSRPGPRAPARRSGRGRRRRAAATSATRWTPRKRDHSATWRRSGWRRCRSSERYDATTATGPSNGREKRKLRRSRVDWSAQWVSSMTSSSGAFSAAVSRSTWTASKRSVRSSAEACSVPRSSPPMHPATGLEAGEGGVLRGDLVDDVGQVGGEAAEHLGERQVRQGAVAEVEAVAGEDLPALGEGEVAQLDQQPGLADAGVTREQDHADRLRRTVPGRTDAERRSYLRQLGVSPDQGPTRVCCHVDHDPVFCGGVRAHFGAPVSEPCRTCSPRLLLAG